MQILPRNIHAAQLIHQYLQNKLYEITLRVVYKDYTSNFMLHLINRNKTRFHTLFVIPQVTTELKSDHSNKYFGPFL